MLDVGENVVGGQIVHLWVATDGNTIVALTALRDPASGDVPTVTYSPAVTRELVSVSVEALMRGQLPPIVS